MCINVYIYTYIYVYVYAHFCMYRFTLSQPFLQVKIAFMAIMLWKIREIQKLIKSIDDSAWTCAQKCYYMERRAWVKKTVLLINIYIYMYNSIHNYFYIYIYT
jgi:hypothetical protein